MLHLNYYKISSTADLSKSQSFSLLTTPKRGAIENNSTAAATNNVLDDSENFVNSSINNTPSYDKKKRRLTQTNQKIGELHNYVSKFAEQNERVLSEISVMRKEIAKLTEQLGKMSGVGVSTTVEAALEQPKFENMPFTDLETAEIYFKSQQYQEERVFLIRK